MFIFYVWFMILRFLSLHLSRKERKRSEHLSLPSFNPKDHAACYDLSDKFTITHAREAEATYACARAKIPIPPNVSKYFEGTYFNVRGLF